MCDEGLIMAMSLKLNWDVTHNEDLFLASSSGGHEELLLTTPSVAF